MLRATPRAVLADGGYWSEANVRLLEVKGIEVLIATHLTTRSNIAGS